ncbi:DUF1566 domain-containing protein [Candidatus Magnetobacterium casense]|uniref:Lcl C-terminal domain-containing protein n=1 Tax=Candidatus Magnetobacterium casense TaxID=1455061 RepID=UPI000697AD57|nr:DUF1566 domain-containing protein [Candidatus Magnetobacterium casensis]
MFGQSNNPTIRDIQNCNTPGIRTLLMLALFVVIGAMCINGAVYASTVNLPQTGQATSDADGDDGAIRTGVAWPNPRFTYGDMTITDNLTGLVWTTDAGTAGLGLCTAKKYKTWQEALDYITCLNVAKYAGYSDWRLPNINELESLSNLGVTDSSAWLKTQGFTGVNMYNYWSSTSYSINKDYAWVVIMFS